MKYIKLNDGNEMPILGFGVFQIPEEETATVVLNAVKAGYRLFDTAQIYGNEKPVGKALKESGVDRNNFFITSKIWISNAGYAKAKASIDKSLEDLQTNYIDLMLVHQPFGDYYGTWRALEEAKQAGKIKSIGVSNFAPVLVEDLITFNNISPTLNQIELNPFYQRQDEVSFYKNKEIQIQSWASFAEGKNGIFTNEILAKIGNKYNKSVAQVILRWLIQNDIAVIPKSVTPSRIKENINVFDFELTKEDIIAIEQLDLGTTQFFDPTKPETVLDLAQYKL
ncbi:aldo/keto reductase [Spiroplasma sp. SV19]|uniref:aldo/keto reductase n=1 Tax=Spiroplasma sp. SV19 TaxID=2570468 RepID=UPI0024B806E9|nr:aldo/keto reductase [Spiroplasma sp. SV19]WHQ36812.1 aldo/keto reductase [Spiroplasma sp. SV19]